jgi:ribonuclease P protein component
LRSNRLLTAADYQGVQRGRKNQTAHFELRIQKHENVDRGGRLGIVVGKKQLKRAVDRNAVKRIARELFRTGALINVPVDVVVRLHAYSKQELRPRAWQQKRVLAQELKAALEALQRRIAS